MLRTCAALCLSLTALAVALPAAAQAPVTPPPTPVTQAPPQGQPNLDYGDVWIADMRRPTIVELAKLRWDETHRRYDTARSRRCKD